jgi:hypothetical protein
MTSTGPSTTSSTVNLMMCEAFVRIVIDSSGSSTSDDGGDQATILPPLPTWSYCRTSRMSTHVLRSCVSAGAQNQPARGA